MTGMWHGHVLKRSDGLLARCGGPGLCAECRFEQEMAALHQPTCQMLRPPPPGFPFDAFSCNCNYEDHVSAFPQVGDTGIEPGMEAIWRVGRKVGRTIYNHVLGHHASFADWTTVTGMANAKCKRCGTDLHVDIWGKWVDRFEGRTCGGDRPHEPVNRPVASVG